MKRGYFDIRSNHVDADKTKPHVSRHVAVTEPAHRENVASVTKLISRGDL
jgi:hypothetical protein